MRPVNTLQVRARLSGIALTLGLAILALAPGCKKKKDALVGSGEARQVVTVRQIVPIAEMADIIQLPGVTEPNRVVNVASEVAGRVEEIPVEEGQTVICGEAPCVIVKLNTELLQAAYDRFKSEAEFQQRDFDRLLEAQSMGVATQTEVDQARMQAASYKALMDSAKAELDRSTIVAPIDGIVNELPIETGEYLQPGTLVAQIVDLSIIKVTVAVPERDVGYLALGDDVTVLANHRGQEQEFTGTITYISQLADASTFTSRVEVSVANDDRTFRTGQLVDVHLTRQVIPNALTVPLLALIPREDDYIAYVVNDGKAHQRVVEFGLIRGQDVRILSGLEAGDQLIVEGHHYVSDGQEVEIVEPITETDIDIDAEPADPDAEAEQLTAGALP